MSTAGLFESGQSPVPIVAGVSALELLARGRRATVYRGMQEALARPVTVKVFDAGSLDGARLEGLSERASALSHPHLLGLIQVLPSPGAATLLWEWVHARPLSDALARRISLPAQVVARQLVEALIALDGAGLPHACLHPGNVLLGMAHQVYLTDYGIPAPPLAYREPAEPARADVHALGLILCELAAGSRLIEDLHLPVEPASVLAAARANSEAPRRLLEAASACLSASVSSPGAALREVRDLLGVLDERVRSITSPGNPLALGHVLAAQAPSGVPRAPARMLGVVGVLAGIVGLTVLGSLIPAQAPDAALPSTPPSVTLGLGRLRLEWPAAERARPTVAFESIEASEPRRTKAGVPTTGKYRIDITDLRPGALYSMRVVAGNGQSGTPMSIRMPDARAADLHVDSVPGGLEVRWRPTVDWPVELSFQRVGSHDVEHFEIPAGGAPRAVVRGAFPGSLGMLRVSLLDPLGDHSNESVLGILADRCVLAARGEPVDLSRADVETFLESPGTRLVDKQAFLVAAFAGVRTAGPLPAAYVPREAAGSLEHDPPLAGAQATDETTGLVSGTSSTGEARMVRTPGGIRLVLRARDFTSWPVVAHLSAGPRRMPAWVWGSYRARITPPESGLKLWMFDHGPLCVPPRMSKGEAPLAGRWPPISPKAKGRDIILTPLDPAHPPRRIEVTATLLPCPPPPGGELAPCPSPDPAGNGPDSAHKDAAEPPADALPPGDTTTW